METLSEADWEELVVLLEEAPPGRIQVAIRCVDGRVVVTAHASPRLVTWFDRLVHVATVSSGSAFDRALLRELRRLSVH
jgi:hypothetical protein